MNIYEEITRLARDMHPMAVDFAKRLLKVPALSGDEKGVADLYIKEMKELGYDEVFRDDFGNVVGIINGEEDGRTIMYNSHLDHVDTGDLSEWGGYDPYGGEIDICEIFDQDQIKIEKTEVIHGRAAADVKVGGACQIYSGGILIKLREMGYKFKGRYMFTGVVLEEPAEQLGMKMLLDNTFKERGIEYDGVVSSEATSLKLYLGHRGRVEILVTVEGVTSHGSAPWFGVNAVNKSTKLIDKIEEVVSKNAKKDEHLGKSSIALTIINCTPGSMCIVPDRCYITYDRRFIPGEEYKDCIKQIQGVIDELSKEDKDFRANVKVASVPRTTYTGKTVEVPNIKEAWKIDRDSEFVKAAAKALENVGQEVKYGYWDFGTDLSVIAGRDKKPAIGYSPMQEFYCHRPVDRARIDFMEKALAGNVSIFLSLSEVSKEECHIK